MAIDKAIDSAALHADLKGIADSIRAKGGTSAQFTSAAAMKAAVDAISTAPDDPHTLFLLHGDKIEDASMYRVPLTNNGVSVSSDQSKFGGKSLYFNGDSWINFPERYAAYRDKDFTIDWWEYCTTSDANHQSRYFSTDAGGPYDTLGLLLGHLGTQTYCGDGWSMISGAKMFNITQNQWVHWATVRHGNTLLTFRNGVKFAQTPIVGSIPYDEKTMHCIGGWRYSPDQKWIGYLSEFRISNVARWTDNFVPPTAPYTNEKEAVIEPLNITQNGTYDSASVDGYKPVTVDCPVPKEEQEKTINIKESKQYTITPDAGKVLAKVIANVDIKAGADISPFTEILQGEFTLASDVRDIQVEGTEGKLGNKNSYFLCFRTDYRIESGYELFNLITPMFLRGLGWKGVELSAGRNYDNRDFTSNGSVGGFPTQVNDKVTLSTPRASINFKAGATYKWVYLR